MKVKEWMEKLSKLSDDTNVHIEVRANGVEFDTDVDDILYESGNIHLYGDFGDFADSDAKRWWGYSK